MARQASSKPDSGFPAPVVTGFETVFGREHADTFRRDLRADTATRVSTNLQPRSHSVGLLRSERPLLAKPRVVSDAKDNFRKDEDVRSQWSGATWITKGLRQGKQGTFIIWRPSLNGNPLSVN